MPHAAPPAAAPPPRSRRAELCSPPDPPIPQPPPEPAAPMELEPGPEALLDLSFLTEAERCAIAEVLHRDALLRRAEEGRVRWDPQGRPWAATDAGSPRGGVGVPNTVGDGCCPQPGPPPPASSVSPQPRLHPQHDPRPQLGSCVQV